MLQILKGGRYGWSLGAAVGVGDKLGGIEDPDGHSKGFDFILSVVGSW